MKIYKTEEHNEVASTMFNIAQQLSYLGKYEEALGIYEKVLGRAKQQQSQLILFEYAFPVKGGGRSVGGSFVDKYLKVVFSLRGKSKLENANFASLISEVADRF